MNYKQKYIIYYDRIKQIGSKKSNSVLESIEDKVIKLMEKYNIL
jgi:hypothetical protein